MGFYPVLFIWGAHPSTKIWGANLYLEKIFYGCAASKSRDPMWRGPFLKKERIYA